MRPRRRRRGEQSTSVTETTSEVVAKDVKRTRKKRDTKNSEKVYDLIKPELLARVDEIIACERGMKYYIKAEGYKRLTEHYIHAGDVAEFKKQLERCLNDECYIDVDRQDCKFARIVHIVKF